MEFRKYEGLGNDFVIVDVPRIDVLSAARAKSVCDRHFGVGADGVLLVSPARTPGCRATMTVINADGSRPEMCGNGLRCVALYLAQLDAVTVADYQVDTDAGPRGCKVERSGETAQVTIEMGCAVALGNLALEFEGKRVEFLHVSTGNPHAITFDSNLDPPSIDRFAPLVSATTLGGLNVEFATQKGPDEFEVTVWERGVGRTLACGTGAVATAVAAGLSGRAGFDRSLRIVLPGGPLDVSVREGTLQGFLSGPAKEVFRGRLV